MDPEVLVGVPLSGMPAVAARGSGGPLDALRVAGRSPRWHTHIADVEERNVLIWE